MNKFKGITTKSVYIKALRTIINTEDEISRKLDDGKLNILEAAGLFDNLVAGVTVIKQAISLRGQWADFELSEEDIESLAREYADTFGVAHDVSIKIIEHATFALEHFISLTVWLKDVRKKGKAA